MNMEIMKYFFLFLEFQLMSYQYDPWKKKQKQNKTHFPKGNIF